MADGSSDNLPSKFFLKVIETQTHRGHLDGARVADFKKSVTVEIGKKSFF